MRWLVAALLAVVLTCGPLAAEPQPLLVVIELDPWRDVIGSDPPVLALYDDGTLVIAPRERDFRKPFVSRRVTPGEFPKVVAEMMPADGGVEHRLSSATDQRRTMVWTPERWFGVYGRWRREEQAKSQETYRRHPEISAREEKLAASLPENVRALLERIDSERTQPGAPWLPAKIEVIFWPYEYAPEASIVWPAHWPGLNAPGSRRRDHDSYCVYLPSFMLPKLFDFSASRKEKGAILIEGRKMASALRYPFPGESRWGK